MRESFDRELQRLQTEIIRMGSEVEEHLTQVTAAFVERDAVTARRMIAADEAINERRIKIGLDALTLIATQQPMARDLRLIAAIMEIVGELERIHDYIKGIGKISLSVGATPILPTIAAHMPEGDKSPAGREEARRSRRQVGTDQSEDTQADQKLTDWLRTVVSLCNGRNEFISSV